MAAAFAALVSLQNNLRLIKNHPIHSFSFEEKQMESLWESVSFLIDFMKSYNGSHGARREAAEALERRVARAAEAAEDVVESHVVDQLRSGKTRSKRRSPRFLLDLQKVAQGMDYMRRKASRVKEQSRMEAEQPAYSAPATPSTPVASKKKTKMVGFGDVSLQLLHLLIEVSSSRRVIPIVGMGGIGKTTLARDAFELPLVMQYFDLRLWATISEEYSAEKIVKELLSCLRKAIVGLSNVDEYSSRFGSVTASASVGELRDELYKSLYGRRYLIVLDDMWSVKAWDDLQFLFPDTHNGSRVVVTTRNFRVPIHLGVSWLGVSFLDEENSWDLFCEKAFEGQGCPPELEEIGKKIAGKCRGLPLAIVVVGGHLRKSSMTLEYWESVGHHLNSILNSTDNEQWLNVLSLSYTYLPVHLKPCFLLLGAFPEDERIKVGEVCKLWIAEGIIEFEQVSRLEEVAEHYVRQLCERNLILIDEVSLDGYILSFRVHDLVREMCVKIGKQEDFLYVFDSVGHIDRERRVVIRGKDQDQKISSDAPIRCLMCEGQGLLSYDFKLLRSLSIPFIDESFMEQPNLRFVKVDTKYTSPPFPHIFSSISLLWNLQILRLDMLLAAYGMVVPYVYDIWEMLQLRHLEVDSICLTDPLPVDDQSHLILRDLHTLRTVVNLRLSEEVCRRIPNVREVCLFYYGEPSWVYCLDNMGKFHELESITCYFYERYKWHDFALSLTFPSSLKLLSLSGCRLEWEEMTSMVGCLPLLTGLQLLENSVTGAMWTPVEGHFLRLKRLDIYGCHDLTSWNADNSHFPVLQYLNLRNLSNLDDFPSGIGDIPTLQQIHLQYCSESCTLSAMRTLMEQEELGNESLQLAVSFQGDEETLERFTNKVEEEGVTSYNIFLSLQNL